MKFVAGEPAIVVGKNLIISDLHLGIELELQSKGIEISSYEKEAQRINKLMKQSKCTKLIVLGDFKHDYFGFKNREFWILKKFLKLLGCKDVLVVKGNHDAELERFEEVKVANSTGYILEAEGKKYGLFHGHAVPSSVLLEQSDVFLFGNVHPLVEISEGDRFAYTAPVWVIGKTKANQSLGLKKGKKWVLFPAFGSLSGGIAVNKKAEWGQFLSKENVDLPNCELFTLDGQKLGLLKRLR